ncbi:hypothetical protein BuS5_03125 [Desulfosarcina sp. BuS5]|uniref:DUF4258 domain-containing protein n=1 Tax=Desulfosarcina sp. BuS5 TaxID=933262 RepID=UPI0009FF0DA1|nr:DUF4258 domain-containing protein [Desulfosarcina sp. BuS5]WDN90155.1 hypothetical protein BuS5_03125 [Desulfosarcina sp. BuS5]
MKSALLHLVQKAYYNTPTTDLEKGISRASVKHIICTGKMIENYPDNKPFPSGLFYGIWQNQPLHAVIVYDLTEQKIFLITAYWPDEEHFETDLKTRRR